MISNKEKNFISAVIYVHNNENEIDKYNEIMLAGKYQGREDILKGLQQLKDERILDLKDMEQSRLEELAKTLGIKPEDIKALSEIDIEREIETRKRENKD